MGQKENIKGLVEMLRKVEQQSFIGNGVDYGPVVISLTQSCLNSNVCKGLSNSTKESIIFLFGGKGFLAAWEI